MTSFILHMGDPSPRRGGGESAEQRKARLARERALLDEARAEFANGLSMDEGEVEAWLDSLDGDEDRPLPNVRDPRKSGK